MGDCRLPAGVNGFRRVASGAAMLVVFGLVGVASASVGAAHLGTHRPARSHADPSHIWPEPAPPNQWWARARRPRAEDCFDAMFDGDFQDVGEIPGARPFTPEPESEYDASHVAGHVEGAETGAHLPPSSLWTDKRVPERNSLAHMKLLGELDGKQVLHAVGDAEPTWEQPSLPAPALAGAVDPWHLGEGAGAGAMDCMVPFGAPSRPDSANEMLVDGQVVSYAQEDDEYGNSEHLSARPHGASKQSPLSPLGKVDANVRDYVRRARFSAVHSDSSFSPGNGDGKSGVPGSMSEWKGDNAKLRAIGQSDDFEGACPGSPVSSMWSQDPCGYWVGRDDLPDPLPADFDLGYYCDLPGPSTSSGHTPLPIRRDGSSGDLWSTVEREDDRAQHMELERMASGCDGGMQIQESALGVPASKVQSGSDQWCDRFVPRPLQHEFSRELRWFAWQGHSSGDGTEKKRPEPARQKPASESVSCSRKVQSRKQLTFQAPFALAMPLTKSCVSALSLSPFNLHLSLRDAFIIQADSSGDDDLKTSGRKEMEDRGIFVPSESNTQGDGGTAVGGELEFRKMEMLVVGQDASVGSASQHGGNVRGAGRLDEVQIFKIREMLHEMHRSLRVHGPSFRGGHGRARTEACQHVWDGTGDAMLWRLIMYNAMMHAQSRVAAVGHASVHDGIAILERMTGAGVPPSVQTYNRYLAVVAGAATHGHGNGTHADDAFARMSQAGIAPNRESYWLWLSVLGSAVYHGQATMQQVYCALQSINQASIEQSAPAAWDAWGPIMRDDSGKGGVGDGEGAVQEDVTCLQLCLRAAVGGAHRGLAGKQDVDWVLRRLRCLQLEVDHDTWALAMHVIVIAAQRGDATLAHAQQLLEQAEGAGYVASPTLHCAFFQTAAAVVNRFNGRKNKKQLLDVRERVMARLQRLEVLCKSQSSPPGGSNPHQHSLLTLTQAVRAYVDHQLGGVLRESASRALKRGPLCADR